MTVFNDQNQEEAWKFLEQSVMQLIAQYKALQSEKETLQTRVQELESGLAAATDELASLFERLDK